MGDPSDEHPPPDLPVPPLPSDDDGPRRPLGLPADHAAAADLAAEEAEVRRLVESGAQTPEELRQLAARLRELRQREDALWRSEVKPGLVKARKGRLGSFGGDRDDAGRGSGSAQQSLLLGGGLLVLVLVVVLLAASGSFLVVLVPVVALLAYAWWQGRQSTGAD